MQGIQYTVDLVLCIDCTGSMNSIITRVKASALRFHEDIRQALEKKSKAISQLRVRVVGFRDYYADGAQAMRASEFFVLPEQKTAFSTFVEGCRAEGGGDEPENGLEALALAIRSEWTKEGDKRRQLIVVWTDASAHPLEHNTDSKPAGYPQDMPKNFNELTDCWEGQSYVSHNAKRLLLFAPDAHGWTDIANHWENTIQYPAKAGEGLNDKDYDEILTAIANSV